MNVVTAPYLSSSLYRTAPAAGTPSGPAAGSGGTSTTDQVALSRESRRKMWKGVAWAGFGVQCVGAAVTLTGGGWAGVAIFAVGSAAIVGGEYMARKA